MVCETTTDLIGVGEVPIQLVGEGIVEAISCKKVSKQPQHKQDECNRANGKERTITLSWESVEASLVERSQFERFGFSSLTAGGTRGAGAFGRMMMLLWISEFKLAGRSSGESLLTRHGGGGYRNRSGGVGRSCHDGGRRRREEGEEGRSFGR